MKIFDGNEIKEKKKVKATRSVKLIKKPSKKNNSKSNNNLIKGQNDKPREYPKTHGLKILPIGGLKEIGKNMTLFEYEDDILILDCGMSFPDEGMHGIDVVIPDFSYVLENKKKIMDKWYFDCARKLFPDVVDKWLKILGESIEHLSIKPMKTRWGSCNYNKRYINLNTELVKRTPFEIEYVVLHELAHLKYPNHGKGFYNYIENYMPNYKKAEKMLNAKHYY